MPIVNRDLDPNSQQRDFYTARVAPTATGATYALLVVPYPAQLIAAAQTATGLSGAPNHSLFLQRFVVGAGVTSNAIGMSLVASAFATSGPQGFTVLGAGGSLLLQANDVILLATAAANTNAADVSVTLVLRALQDIKSAFGV